MLQLLPPTSKNVTKMPPINYQSELGQARCHAIMLQKHNSSCREDAGTGCWLFTGSKNGDGYCQVGCFHHYSFPLTNNKSKDLHKEEFRSWASRSQLTNGLSPPRRCIYSCQWHKRTRARQPSLRHPRMLQPGSPYRRVPSPE